MSIARSLSRALTRSLACSSRSLPVAEDLAKFNPFSVKLPGKLQKWKSCQTVVHLLPTENPIRPGLNSLKMLGMVVTDLQSPEPPKKNTFTWYINVFRHVMTPPLATCPLQRRPLGSLWMCRWSSLPGRPCRRPGGPRWQPPRRCLQDQHHWELNSSVTLLKHLFSPH